MNNPSFDVSPIEGAIVLREHPGFSLNGIVVNQHRFVRRPDGYEFVEMIATNNVENPPLVRTIFQLSISTLRRLENEGILSKYRLFLSSKSGYPAWHTTATNVVCLHQFAKNHIGHGKGQISVDHINQNKLDNRIDDEVCNLRIATQSEQNLNRNLSPTVMNPILSAAVGSIIPIQIRDEKQKDAFLAYRHLLVSDDPNFQPVFPHNMYMINEEDARKQFIVIDTHRAMREDGWLGCKAGKPEVKRWTSSKSLDVDLKSKLLTALEVYHHLDVHRQVPDHVRNERALNGNAIGEAPFGKANYFTYSAARHQWNVGERHPIIGGDKRGRITGVKGEYLTDKERLFDVIEKLERQAMAKSIPFAFPSFSRAPPGLEADYNHWKVERKTPQYQLDLERRKSRTKNEGYKKRSANNLVKKSAPKRTKVTKWDSLTLKEICKIAAEQMKLSEVKMTILMECFTDPISLGTAESANIPPRSMPLDFTPSFEAAETFVEKWSNSKDTFLFWITDFSKLKNLIELGKAGKKSARTSARDLVAKIIDNPKRLLFGASLKCIPGDLKQKLVHLEMQGTNIRNDPNFDSQASKELLAKLNVTRASDSLCESVYPRDSVAGFLKNYNWIK